MKWPKQMTKNLEDKASASLPEDVLEAIDIEDAEKEAQSDVIAQREESLAKQLAEMRKRKRKLVDPLQFEMSIMDQDLQVIHHHLDGKWHQQVKNK